MKQAVLVRKLNAKLDEIIFEDLPLLKKVKKFVIQSGGKRLRPILHYYVCKLLGYKGDQWQDVGAIGELIHAASLLHDDVVDEADERRGEAALHTIHGNKQVILSGDYLLACGFQHVSTLNRGSDLLVVFTGVIRALTVGELIQMKYENDLTIGLDEYEQIIEGKTATLFSAMTECAAIMTGLDQTSRKAMREFGMRMGRLFQIRDDYLDYFSTKESMGKSLYQDFDRGLVTYPVIKLKRKLTGKDWKRLKELWKNKDDRISEQSRMWMADLMRAQSIDTQIASEIEEEIHRLMKFLREFEAADAREKLVEALRRLLVPIGG